MASYNASKAAVIAISETMHFELMPYGVGVMALCPGFFRTNLANTMKTSDPEMLKFVDKVFDKSELSGEERSEEHTSELQSRPHLVCRLLLEKKKKKNYKNKQYK